MLSNYGRILENISRPSLQPDPKTSSVVEIAHSPDDVEPPSYAKHDFNGKSNKWFSRPSWVRLPNHRRGSLTEVHKPWKPMTLQGPVLGGFALLSLAMILVLEILLHISLQHGNDGSLVFAADVDSLPTGVIFW
jgi:hypothetical protein